MPITDTKSANLEATIVEVGSIKISKRIRKFFFLFDFLCFSDLFTINFK